MKLHLLLVVAPILFAGCATKLSRQPKEKSVLYSLTTGKAKLVADPALGARIISLRYNNIELLYGGYDNRESFGSTLWPSPQSDWNWPPIDTLDFLPYQVIATKTDKQFVSLPSLKTGYQVTKSFIAGQADSSFLLTYSIKNISPIEKRVGCWEVTRVFPGATTFFPAAPDSGVLARSTLPGVTNSEGIIWFKYDAAAITQKAKMYAMAKEGWLANIKDGVAFIKSFADQPSGSIAPGQGEVEIYANDQPRYVEVENHGVYATLLPDDSVLYKVKWYLRTVPKNLLGPDRQGVLVDWVRKVVGGK